jgi:hypothetical protein
MTEMNELVRLAVDAYNNKVEKYSVKESQEVLRKALIEANNGSTKLDYKAIRDGKCNGLFALIEEILSKTVVEGIQEDALINALVDFRNVAEGDANLFVVEDSTLFVVDDTAKGTQGVRRQRLGGDTEVIIPTVMKTVRIYEELNRVLAGRVDFNRLIDKVAESFRAKLLDDVYTLWGSATAAQIGGSTYCVSGSYNEDSLIDLIAHVEAAAGGKQATIIGTKKACRKLVPGVVAEAGKEDMYKLGFWGYFNGTPVVATPQRHKVGTTTFAYDDNMLTIVAGDDKPVKVVYEGNPIVIMGDPLANADFTQEYFYGEQYGIGLVLAGGNAGIGKYEITA